MKSDHALAQPIFRNNIPIAIGKFLAASYKLQLDSAALYSIPRASD